MRLFYARRQRVAGGVVLRARRLALILPGLLTLAIQILAVQPHVHLARLSMASLAAASEDGLAKTTSSLPKGKNGPSGDSTNCPLCQTAARGGHGILPITILDSLPAPVFVAVGAEPLSPRVAAVSHDWLGRAPPA